MPDQLPGQGPGSNLFDLFGSRARRRRPAAKGPRVPARIIQAARNAGPVLQRATVYGTVGYLAYQGLNWYIDKKNREQDLRAIALMKKQDQAANYAARAARIRLEKEKERRRVEEAGLAAVNRYYGFDPNRPPPPPDARWVPGTPEHIKQQAIEQNAESVRRKAEARAAAGLPPVYQGPVSAAAPAAVPVPSTKEKIKAKIAAAAASPFFLPGAALVIGLLTKPKGASAPPQLQDFEPPLTESQPSEVFFGGELGGVPQLELEPDTGTAGDKCEKIDPARSVGECRQGWFSETPEKLYLKEWSRRPCQ